MTSLLSDETPLIQAVFNGDADEVRSLIYKKEEVNSLDGERRTPLHAAAYLGDIDIINLLILSGARVNAKDVRWLTPLHRACAKGHDDAVNILLKHQADVNARDKLWQSPLHVAAANNAVSCAELILPHLSNLNFADRAGRQALHHAAFNGHLNMVNLLLSHGANVNAYDRQDRRAIHWAAYIGSTEIINALVSHGADINCRDKHLGDTPMHAAAAAGQISAVKVLLNLGVDINAQNSRKDTALHRACCNGQDVVVNELLEENAEVDICNDQGMTPLHYAAASSDGAVCLELLVTHCAKVNVHNNAGKTPLHMTAVHGRFARSQTLLQSGAHADAVDNYGNSALHVAAKYGHDLLVGHLLDSGADPFRKGSHDRLPIHLAALEGHANCCRKLLISAVNEEAGITPFDVISTLDEGGRSCLHHAACGGSLECLDLFLGYTNSIDIINQCDSEGRMPLHYALSSARKECVQRLLSSSIQNDKLVTDLNSTDKAGRSFLHHASAVDSSGECVELILDHGADPMSIDANGNSPLHYAAAFGHDQVVKLLVSSDNNVLKATHGNEQEVVSPLHLAAYYGHVNVVLFLAQYAEYLINLDIADNQGRTALELAAFQGNSECQRALQIQGARATQKNLYNNRTALHAAACHGHTKCMQLLIEGVMNDQTAVDEPNALSKFINARDGDKCTALMHCVTNGHQSAVEFLLLRNAKIWPVDKFGCTVLHRAAVAGHEDIVRVLLSHQQQQRKFTSYDDISNDDNLRNADFSSDSESLVSARSHNGRTPLHFAAIRGNASMLEALLQVAQTVNVIDRYGYTPLHYACFEGHEPCVDAMLLHDSFNEFQGSIFSPLHCAMFNDNEACGDRLIETFGKDIVHLTDKKNRTPLHACAMGDSTDSSLFLLSHGANVDAIDENGQTPLMYAARLGNEACLEIFITAKADHSVHDSNLNNCLHLAAMNSHEDCILLLLDSVKDLDILDAQNIDGKTPLHIAAKNGLPRAVKKLINCGADVDVDDNQGLNAALCCAPNLDVVDCLDWLIMAMVKKSRYETIDVDSIQESLDSLNLRESNSPNGTVVVRKRLSSLNYNRPALPDNIVSSKSEETNARGTDASSSQASESDSETY